MDRNQIVEHLSTHRRCYVDMKTLDVMSAVSDELHDGVMVVEGLVFDPDDGAREIVLKTDYPIRIEFSPEGIRGTAPNLHADIEGQPKTVGGHFKWEDLPDSDLDDFQTVINELDQRGDTPGAEEILAPFLK